MKIKIVKNKYLNTLFIIMLVSAVAHIIILIVRSFAEKSIYPLNFFHILNLDYFFPNVFLNNFSGDLAPFLFLAFLYLFILQINDGKK